MKKRLFPLLIIPFISISLFCSCASKKDKIRINQMDDITSFIYLTSDELNDLITHKESFVLTIGENGCSTCDIIKPVLENYISKYHRIIYWAETSSYQNTVSHFQNDNETNLISQVSSSTILLFNKGQYSSMIEYDANLYYSENKLDAELSKNICSSGYFVANDKEEFSYSENFTMYRMNYEKTDSLDNLILNNEKFKILYYWKDCNDCKELKESFLDDYIYKNNIKLYEYEVSATRSKKNEDGSSDLTSFKEFADKYEFSSYRNGKVPSLVEYTNASKTNMVVYANDEIIEIDGNYVITESFYKDLINISSSSKIDLYNTAIAKEKEYIIDFLNQ